MPTLSETQRLLWSLITAPEGVPRALAEPDRGPALARALERTVRSGERLSAVERLDVYANMYFFRLLDVIKHDYPAVLAVAGEQNFHNLVTDYLLVHVPSHPSLRYAGAHLAPFIRTHPLRDVFPALFDLARLEWALVDAFDVEDAPVLTAGDLAVFAPERWGALRFRFHPSVQMLDCDWEVHALRQHVDRDEAVGTAAPGRTTLCVWRGDWRVYYRALAELEGRVLRLLLRGADCAAACALAAESVGDDPAAAAVASNLATWLRDGMLSGVVEETK